MGDWNESLAAIIRGYSLPLNEALELEARVAALEADARRLQEVLNRVPVTELNAWMGANMERFDRAPTLDEFRAAIDAAARTPPMKIDRVRLVRVGEGE